MYTSANFDENDSEELKESFHKLFEEYKVDQVLYVILNIIKDLFFSYNNDDPIYPIVMEWNNNKYINNDGGITCITAGTTGDELHKSLIHSLIM